MNSETLHAQFPFTVDLVFAANKKWADPDHQTLTKPCFKAGRNLSCEDISIQTSGKESGGAYSDQTGLVSCKNCPEGSIRKKQTEDPMAYTSCSNCAIGA